MSGTILALLHPLGCAVLAGGAVLGAEEMGIPIDWPQVSGGVVAYLILQQVFAHLRAKKVHGGDEERLEVQQKMAACLETQTEILQRMDGNQAKILETTTQYQRTGICPFTNPEKRRDAIREIADEIRVRRGRQRGE